LHHLGLFGAHAFFIGQALVIHALGMQGAVDDEVNIVGLEVASQSARVLLYHLGAQHQVSTDHRDLVVFEGQHVGSVVSVSVCQVQLFGLMATDTAHGQLSRALQSRADPLDHLMTRQQLAVARVGHLQRQHQGRLHRVDCASS